MAKHLPTEFDSDVAPNLALATLRSFFKKMHDWEKIYYKKRMDEMEKDLFDPELKRCMRADLFEIFSEYVVDKKRNYDRLENLVCGLHPEYDLIRDEIGKIEFKKNIATVVIEKKTGMSSVFRILLCVEGESCKVQARELKSSGGKWQATYI